MSDPTSHYWQNRAEKAEAALVPLVKLVNFLFQTCVIEGGDLEGFWMQEELEKLGCIVSVPYNRERHGDVEDAEPGDPIYELAPEWEARVDALPKETT